MDDMTPPPKWVDDRQSRMGLVDVARFRPSRLIKSWGLALGHCARGLSVVALFPSCYVLPYCTCTVLHWLLVACRLLLVSCWQTDTVLFSSLVTCHLLPLDYCLVRLLHLACFLHRAAVNHSLRPRLEKGQKVAYLGAAHPYSPPPPTTTTTASTASTASDDPVRPSKIPPPSPPPPPCGIHSLPSRRLLYTHEPSIQTEHTRSIYTPQRLTRAVYAQGHCARSRPIATRSVPFSTAVLFAPSRHNSAAASSALPGAVAYPSIPTLFWWSGEAKGRAVLSPWRGAVSQGGRSTYSHLYMAVGEPWLHASVVIHRASSTPRPLSFAHLGYYPRCQLSQSVGHRACYASRLNGSINVQWQRANPTRIARARLQRDSKRMCLQRRHQLSVSLAIPFHYITLFIFLWSASRLHPVYIPSTFRLHPVCLPVCFPSTCPNRMSSTRLPIHLPKHDDSQ